MNKLSKAIETLSNVAIIVIAILVCWVFTRDYITQKPSAAIDTWQNTRPPVPDSGKIVGQTLSVSGLEWAAKPYNMVLALDSKCHFCEESAPFYKTLASKVATDDNIELIVVSPEPEDVTRRFLDSLGVKVSNVRQIDFHSIGILGTPSLLMVDRAGVVKHAWLGRLAETRQAEVWRALQ